MRESIQHYNFLRNMDSCKNEYSTNLNRTQFEVNYILFEDYWMIDEFFILKLFLHVNSNNNKEVSSFIHKYFLK